MPNYYSNLIRSKQDGFPPLDAQLYRSANIIQGEDQGQPTTNTWPIQFYVGVHDIELGQRLFSILGIRERCQAVPAKYPTEWVQGVFRSSKSVSNGSD